jgi:hypothetical protein
MNPDPDDNDIDRWLRKHRKSIVETWQTHK